MLNRKVISYPSRKFIHTGKTAVNGGGQLTVNVRSKRLRKFIDRARPFLLNDGGADADGFAVFMLFLSAFKLLVVHFYAMGAGYQVDLQVDDDVMRLHYYAQR